MATVLGRKPSSLSPARDALMKKGLVYSAERGTLAFTVPHFGRWLRSSLTCGYAPPVTPERSDAPVATIAVAGSRLRARPGHARPGSRPRHLDPLVTGIEPPPLRSCVQV